MYSEKVNDLFHSQLESWELAKNNYDQLGKVRVRTVDFTTFEIIVQFNPSRIRSSAANVDAKSLSERPCFLCNKNLPPQQRGVSFEGGLTILVNPYPIFPRHLTIPSQLHTDQRIDGNFSLMLNLAQSLPDYVIFYNGPECGASAPDHFHFQAGNKGFMPVERDFNSQVHTRLLYSGRGFELWSWEGYKRSMFSLKGNDLNSLLNIFSRFYEKFSELKPDRPEPMMNILAYYNPDEWIIHIMPRRLHRPWQFYSKGEEQIILSPAAVDLGGVIITPREEDFLKLTKNDITDIFSQICLEDNDLQLLISAIA